MDDRQVALEESIMRYCFLNSEQLKAQIMARLEEKQDEILKYIVGQFHQMFLDVKNLQEEEPSYEIAMMLISFLNYSMLSNTIELRISLYDKNSYLDEKSVTVYLPIHFLDDIIEKDMQDFKKYIDKTLVRVDYAELYHYRRICMGKYKSVIENFMQAYLELIVKLKSFVSMKKTDDFQIIFGEFMCKGTALYTCEVEEQ